MEHQQDGVAVIFRRFITIKSGKRLDAYKFGRRAWPIKVKDKPKPKKH